MYLTMSWTILILNTKSLTIFMNQTLKSVSQHPYIVNGWFTNYEFSSWSIKFSNCCLAILTFAMVDLLTLKSTTTFICLYWWIRLTQFCFGFLYFLIVVKSGFKIFYLKLKKKNRVKYSTKNSCTDSIVM